jgi:hypothetical protein
LDGRVKPGHDAKGDFGHFQFAPGRGAFKSNHLGRHREQSDAIQTWGLRRRLSLELRLHSIQSLHPARRPDRAVAANAYGAPALRSGRFAMTAPVR